MSVGDDRDRRGWAPPRPIRRAEAGAPARLTLAITPPAPKVSIGRHAARHYCARCGAKRAACRCDLPPAA